MDAGKTNATFIWVFPIWGGGGFQPDVEALFVHQQFWNLGRKGGGGLDQIKKKMGTCFLFFRYYDINRALKDSTKKLT
jgi:hypothetical protein